jgi:hypothetical protein
MSGIGFDIMDQEPPQSACKGGSDDINHTHGLTFAQLWEIPSLGVRIAEIPPGAS